MKRIFETIVMVLLICPAGVRAGLPVSVDGQPLPSLAPVLKEVTPSVVNVFTRTRVRVRSPLLDDPLFRRFFNVPDRPRERISQSLGSGVIVDAEQGYILTNNHVIEGADDIAVTLKDGRSLEAEVIGLDPDTDLAVIRVSADQLTELKLADSDELQVGDFVVAVGNPFGLGQTVTSGIVSALGRTGFRGLEYQNFIQTDASINPGNSGGALVNLRGELVGINSAIFTPSGGNVGIGFAIPSSMARYVLEQLIRFGEVRRGTLGIFVQELTPDLAGAFGIEPGQGALIAEVGASSAADKAGLKPGDVVISVADRPVGSAQDFLNAEGRAPIGEKVRVGYLRNEKEGSVSLLISEVRELRGSSIDPRLAGALFTEVPASESTTGVLLAELEHRSRLAYRGLRSGDIITAVNGQPITSLDDLESIVTGVSGRLLLQLRRDGGAYIARID